ncbi:Esterase TesA precursor [Legionella quinlivanii]|uniref:Esterase TesA n=2 Tax=Legionella quinlivanii TaxID=45073 RepID=A0A0W0Y4Y3_9GAMM|nr:Esterase TesA precursor [Legionella quinlivanii]SEF88076.1 acyl-CoA thioesterase-1 [Legionella quinlivanii DSM 21216]STY12475.1 Esterase TesA precursor [Legionella quinlivanii]
MIAPLWAGTVLILGDSLSAGYGLADQKNWVALLDQKLRQYPGNWQTVNLSTSGDTTSNGLAKLPAALQKYKPEIVVIELGANDGLRGLSLLQMSKNLETMINMSRQSNARVVLLATKLPPNYGQQFLTRFDKAYKDLAQKYKLVFVAMFLEGVAGHREYMQNDNIHPNMAAQSKILDNVWPVIEPLIKNTN